MTHRRRLPPGRALAAVCALAGAVLFVLAALRWPALWAALPLIVALAWLALRERRQRMQLQTALHLAQQHTLQAEADEQRPRLRRAGNRSLAEDSRYPLHPYKGMIFRSQSEVRIARALDHAGAAYLAPTRARLGAAADRQGRETDFVIVAGGCWGMLEVDGPWHQPASDAARDALLRESGFDFVRRYSADRCYHEPEAVVAEFLAALRDRSAR